MCSMTSRFGVLLIHLIQTLHEKSILVLCVNWLFLVGYYSWHRTSHCISEYCAALCCSAETIKVYEKWRFSSIINSRENVEALAKKQIVSRRCVVMLGEMKRMAEKHYYCSFV